MQRVCIIQFDKCGTAHQGYSQNKMDDEHLMLLSKEQKTTPSYQPDILGADYQQMTSGSSFGL